MDILNIYLQIWSFHLKILMFYFKVVDNVSQNVEGFIYKKIITKLTTFPMLYLEALSLKISTDEKM